MVQLGVVFSCQTHANADSTSRVPSGLMAVKVDTPVYSCQRERAIAQTEVHSVAYHCLIFVRAVNIWGFSSCMT